MDNIMEEGIFLCEKEISQMVQIVKDFLKDVETNEKEYYSSIDVTGIFSFEKTHQ